MLRKKIIFLFFNVILFLHIDGYTQPYTGARQMDAAETMNGPNPCNEPPCNAVCNEDCGNTECIECIESTQVPLDGGLLWLLLAGAGYGVKKIVDQRKKKG